MDWILKKITDITEAEYTAIYQNLSASRKAHIDRLQKANDKKRSLLATKLVRQLAPDGVLETDEQGRPYLRNCPYYVSISHSHDGVACAVAEQPVGIDVEKIKPVRKALADYICLPGEGDYVRPGNEIMITDEQTLLRFFAVWTAKEAGYKKAGGTLLKIDTLTLEKTTAVIDGYFITVC